MDYPHPIFPLSRAAANLPSMRQPEFRM